MDSPAPVPITIMKFGGTSVGDAEAFRRVIEIAAQTRSRSEPVILVVSAMSGVTDALLECARCAVRGQDEVFRSSAESLRQQHFTVANLLIKDPVLSQAVKADIDGFIAELLNFCQALRVLGEASPRALDAVSALGERLSVRLLEGALRQADIPAQSVNAARLIVTDSAFQSAHPDLSASRKKTRQVLRPLIRKGILPVVTGFVAANAQGVTTTLGRGGSDYSAAILGAVLPAAQVIIWTDVDGVMSADPRLVPQAHTITELSYRETAELAFYGAKVLHPKTIRPVIDAGIPLRVRNTFNPSHPGTLISAQTHSKNDGIIKAVTAIPDLALVTIEGRGMLGVPGVAARTFAAVAATGTSVPLITQASSEQTICFAVPLAAAELVCRALENEFCAEIARHDIDRVWSIGTVVIITAVGAGMRFTPGIAGRIFTALGSQNVNVIAIAQGSSEVSISVVVDASDALAGVRAIHSLIAGPNNSGKST